MEEAKLVWLCKQPVPDWCGLDGCVVDPAAEGYGDVVLGPGYGPYVGAVLEEACAKGVQEACDALKRAEAAAAAFAVAQTGLPPPKPTAANTTEPPAGTQLQGPPVVPPRSLGLPNGTLLSVPAPLPQVSAPRSRLPEQRQEADARTTRNALEVFGVGLQNLAADPNGWFYGPPSALYSNLGDRGAPRPGEPPAPRVLPGGRDRLISVMRRRAGCSRGRRGRRGRRRRRGACASRA